MVGCGWQTGPWLHGPSLYLTLLNFCFHTGKGQTRIWLISWWRLGWQGLYQGLVIIGGNLRTLFMSSFIFITDPRSRYYHYLYFAQEEAGAEGDYITSSRPHSKWWTGIQSGSTVLPLPITGSKQVHESSLCSPMQVIFLNRICSMRVRHIIQTQ